MCLGSPRLLSRLSLCLSSSLSISLWITRKGNSWIKYFGGEIFLLWAEFFLSREILFRLFVSVRGFSVTQPYIVLNKRTVNKKIKINPMKKETLSRKKTKISKGTEVKIKQAKSEHERFYSVFGFEDNVYDEVSTHRVHVTTRIWQSIKGFLLIGLGYSNSLPL